MELIEKYIEEEREKYNYQRAILSTRIYVLISNKAQHLIETDEDCVLSKEALQHHAKRGKMLMDHPFVRLKYLLS
ncbi:hypothetical protein [Bacillus cereus]|uniref:hypothetical protein n=1 Tax=Bacillus cereus TaxID=1396 RepID=UPI000BEE3F88|nr:hypothetical protein [Bacillus cereus]PDY82763.1 hypothetical protein CON06_10185 [Bacillus cereus]